MSSDPRLIVGLDVPSVREAESVVSALSDLVSYYKIGYQLAFTGGLRLAQDLVHQGKKVFLDLKLLDIDNTVAHAVENIIKIGVSMLTVHAYPKVMRAAAQAAQGSELCILGVTVLTSMDAADLHEAGYRSTPETLVLQRAKQAHQAGIGGIVASAQEAAAVRSLIGEDMALVTPGIRLPGQEKGDQKRVQTPQAALAAGASHIVVGRPIVQAENKYAAAEAFLKAMHL